MRYQDFQLKKCKMTGGKSIIIALDQLFVVIIEDIQTLQFPQLLGHGNEIGKEHDLES